MAKVMRAACIISNSTMSPDRRAKQLALFPFLSEDDEREFGE